jgi:Na+-driven multidrug efflux pump
MSVAPASTAPAVAQPAALDPRTRLLLQGSIVPTLLRLAWPNVLVMLAQASTGLIETWWVSPSAGSSWDGGVWPICR